MATPACILQVDFGDGSNWKNLASCFTSPCSSTLRHLYKKPGNYQIAVRPAPAPSFNCTSLNKPKTASITFPVAGKPSGSLQTIHILAPAENEQVPVKEISLSWEEKAGITHYQVEISAAADLKKSVLSAFSKKTAYTIPAALLTVDYPEKAIFYWKVTGFNSSNTVVALSDIQSFSIKKTNSNYVPGRLLILLSAGDEEKNSTLLNDIIEKYNIVLISRKKLSQLGRELVVLTTDEDVEELGRRLQMENEHIQVQPDYYYSTLGRVIEKQNRNNTFKFLRLKTKGKGVRIAIIDTGRDFTHNDLILPERSVL